MRLNGGLKVLALELLTVVGLLVFARGFLPPTRTKLGFSDAAPSVPPQFSRVVLMVVDAMRSDFLFSSESHMPNAHRLFRDGYGYAFTAFSDPPTVTLPRLKGLTTGASPNFLDAVINIAESDSASTLTNQDSWIHQLKAKGKVLHFFGDDTWLKLFPGAFDKFDGTSSFYVADFTEVDQNVTRHLPEELRKSPPTDSHYGAHEPGWDALILHYLGLDHIGHKGGPRSSHMPAKQKEMDDIVQEIFDSLDDSTLFVLAGDHGMNDVGNHGGASGGETSAALALFAKKFRNKLDSPLPPAADYSYYTRLQQVDIVPTLATLLGLPIPKNSLGLFIEELLELWPSEHDQKTIVNTICDQLQVEIDGDETCSMDGLRERQKKLMRDSSDHILPYMYGGLGILFTVTCVCLGVCYQYFSRLDFITFHKEIALLIWWIVFPILYFIGMLGSSTVEEEHYIWYWSLTGLLATMFVTLPDATNKLNVLLLLACFRIIRGWNTAGQKWAALTDTAELLLGHTTTLYIMVVATISLILATGLKNVNAPKAGLSVMAATLAMAFKFSAVYYPVGEPWMILLARAAFVVSAVDAAIGTGSGLVLVFIMQTRLENIPVWIPITLARGATSRLVGRQNGPPKQLGGINKEAFALFMSLVALCLEYASFFAMGGSNSLATIDLSNGYNGVSGYSIPLVAVLTYLGNWSGSLYWTLSSNVSSDLRIFRALFYGVACTSVTLACLILREHLFIWTVFSPKLLYIGAWLVFHELIATTLVAIAHKFR